MSYQLLALIFAQIVVLIVYIMTFIRFLISYDKTQQALQWWSCRQSTKLFLEAEKIRDGLLQESFTIRRSLELLPADNLELSRYKTQECLIKINTFHQSLVQLSDRLFPAYLEDSLPLAIQCVLEPWLLSSKLYFQISLPPCWRQEPAERSLIILRTLEELLTITLPEALAEISIYITLKQENNKGELMVKIYYPDVSTFLFYTNLPELEYICATFQFLTSGKCFFQRKNLNIAWYFYW